MESRILAMLVFLLLIGCQTQAPYVQIAGQNIAIEIADSSEERELGLMFREYLEQDKGMLFVWSEEEYRSFWMKNTKIPLDMIFIDSKGTIVDIITAPPCILDPCESYPSKGKAQFVLEVNAGFSQARGLKIGDRARIAI